MRNAIAVRREWSNALLKEQDPVRVFCDGVFEWSVSTQNAKAVINGERMLSTYVKRKD